MVFDQNHIANVMVFDQNVIIFPKNKKNIFRSRKNIKKISHQEFFGGYSFDVKLDDISIYEVSRAIPAVLRGFWKLSM